MSGKTGNSGYPIPRFIRPMCNNYRIIVFNTGGLAACSYSILAEQQIISTHTLAGDLCLSAAPRQAIGKDRAAV